MSLLKASIITFFKTSIISGATYALVFILVDYLRAKEITLESILWNLIGFGCLMGVISIIQLVYTYNNLNGKEHGDEIFKVRPQKSITSSVSIATLLNKLQLDSYFRNEKISVVSDQEIEINMSWSIASFGEKIKVKSSHIDNDQHRYQIISSPKVPFTLMDAGKNFENVIKLEHLLLT